MDRIKDNCYGKTEDPAVNQIISRILNQHFNNGERKGKTIGEIEDEMMRQIYEKAQIVDFAKGENCEFKGTPRQ